LNHVVTKTTLLQIHRHDGAGMAAADDSGRLSLRRLGVGRIDVYQFHWPQGGVFAAPVGVDLVWVRDVDELGIILGGLVGDPGAFGQEDDLGRACRGGTNPMAARPALS
jgi:aryl-alcohol dehydrogenase-like predicted oxidoreductase